MLSQVLALIRSCGVASIADIAGFLGASPDATRGMVEVWVRKGKVIPVPMACGGCTECGSDAIELYQLAGEGPPETVTAVRLGLDPDICQL